MSSLKWSPFVRRFTHFFTTMRIHSGFFFVRVENWWKYSQRVKLLLLHPHTISTSFPSAISRFPYFSINLSNGLIKQSRRDAALLQASLSLSRSLNKRTWNPLYEHAAHPLDAQFNVANIWIWLRRYTAASVVNNWASSGVFLCCCLPHSIWEAKLKEIFSLLSPVSTFCLFCLTLWVEAPQLEKPHNSNVCEFLNKQSSALLHCKMIYYWSFAQALSLPISSDEFMYALVERKNCALQLKNEKKRSQKNALEMNEAKKKFVKRSEIETREEKQ